MTKKKTVREEIIDKLLTFVVRFWGSELTRTEGEILRETLIEGKKFGDLNSVPHLTSYRQKQIFEKAVLRLISRIQETIGQGAEIKFLRKNLEDARTKLNELEIELAKYQPKTLRASDIPSHLKEILGMQIDDTELSTRVKNACRNANIFTIQELAAISRRDFLRYRSCGALSAIEVEEFLKAKGLSWEMQF